MDSIKSKEIRLASRPTGVPSAENFSMAEVVVQPPGEGQVLVRNLYISVDPYMRGRMNDAASYVPPFQLGSPLDGGAVGEVVDSRAAGFEAGDIVLSGYGWREYFVAPAERLRRVSRSVEPLSLYLGRARHARHDRLGRSADWRRSRRATRSSCPGPPGAVGHVAGQLARIRGCRAIGSAGSADKVAFLRDVCGFDAAFDYKSGPVATS